MLQLISTLGIIVAIAVFVFLAFKGTNLFFNAVIGAAIIVLSANLPLLATLKGAYMTGLSGFLKSYLFLFALSALFGKVMEESGAVRKIALSLTRLTKKTKNQKFWAIMVLPVFYTILTYVGISSFVVVFTVVAIGRELFEEMDIPWLYYCYGSAGIYPAYALAGSLGPTNIIVSDGFKVPYFSGVSLSIIIVIVAYITLGILLKLDTNRFTKKGEGFLPYGAPIKQLQLGDPLPDEKLPSLIISIIPLIVPIIAITVFKSDVLTALVMAIIVCFIIGYKNIKSIQTTLSTGIVASIVPVVNVAAAAGLATIIQVTPGYKMFSTALGNYLPPAASVITIIAVMSASAASSTSVIPAFMPSILEKMGEAGISPITATRLVCASTFTFMTPHNPGVINAVTLTKLPLSKAATVYFKTTFLPGLAGLTVAAILISLGVYQ